ncbi:DUF971 domain-containing protein [Neisseria leonii]|uniref:DUF971 domain-containing protein n=2 Tax=Neisseria leonii TaxID=2995413 RepID=UPI0030D201E8
MKWQTVPQEIRLHSGGRFLSLYYSSGEKVLSAEYLRVYSPSAQVRGHGRGNGVLQAGKADVSVVSLAAAGHYALKITFSDGHDSGLYDWDYLYKLAHGYATMWPDYLQRLQAAGASRFAESAQEHQAAGMKSQRKTS